LKRRQPTPDDSTTAPADGEQPKSTEAPPKLKKNDTGTSGTTKTPDKP
jgi:hypothetical protein